MYIIDDVRYHDAKYAFFAFKGEGVDLASRDVMLQARPSNVEFYVHSFQRWLRFSITLYCSLHFPLRTSHGDTSILHIWLFIFYFYNYILETVRVLSQCSAWTLMAPHIPFKMDRSTSILPHEQPRFSPGRHFAWHGTDA